MRNEWNINCRYHNATERRFAHQVRHKTDSVPHSSNTFSFLNQNVALPLNRSVKAISSHLV